MLCLFMFHYKLVHIALINATFVSSITNKMQSGLGGCESESQDYTQDFFQGFYLFVCFQFQFLCFQDQLR